MTGAAIATRVRAGFYLDSVALMRISREIADLPGVEEASLMIGTPSNKDLMREARLLDAAGEAAGPNDLIIGVRAKSPTALEAALDAAVAALDRPAATGEGEDWHPRSLETALQALPDANLAMISVPGAFAAREGRRALERGLHVMMFSDNVEIADEVALKDLALSRGLLMMGPDCGTAIIAGTPLGFANVVPKGDVGLIAASGTGLQEVSCLLARGGRGISHGIGVGGRDMDKAVGGRMTLSAIEALDHDPATRHVVLISKPPDPAVAARIAERIAASAKAFTVCFIGMAPIDLPANARQVGTLREAATDAGAALPESAGTVDEARRAFAVLKPARAGLRGLYAGGSLCAEAQAVLLKSGLRVASNVPIPGAASITAVEPDAALLIDLGADEYTRGRPHPMIEPAVRDEPLAAALADTAVGVVLVDLVLGFGAHVDPAGKLAETIAEAPASRPVIVASVCGTDGDPQGLADQFETLRTAGVIVASSNAEAAEVAAALLST